MRNYKLVVVLKGDLTKEKKKKMLESIETWAGATDTKITELGEKKLAYTIKREKKGDYLEMNFNSDKIDTGFEKRLINQDDILRHLMLRVK